MLMRNVTLIPSLPLSLYLLCFVTRISVLSHASENGELVNLGMATCEEGREEEGVRFSTAGEGREKEEDFTVKASRELDETRDLPCFPC